MQELKCVLSHAVTSCIRPGFGSPGHTLSWQGTSAVLIPPPMMSWASLILWEFCFRNCWCILLFLVFDYLFLVRDVLPTSNSRALISGIYFLNGVVPLCHFTICWMLWKPPQLRKTSSIVRLLFGTVYVFSVCSQQTGDERNRLLATY